MTIPAFNPVTVWKYKLDMGHGSECVLTFDSGPVLRVDIQGGEFCAWVAVQDHAKNIQRRIVVVATGEPLPAGPPVEYLNTIFSGPFVFHAFIGFVS